MSATSADASKTELRVDSTRVLRPLGPTVVTCSVCKEPRARWVIVHPRYGSDASICSFCFLYDSGWLDRAEAKSAVTRLSNVIGLKRGKVLQMREGRLSRIEDANDVLGAVALHERFEFVTRRRST